MELTPKGVVPDPIQIRFKIHATNSLRGCSRSNSDQILFDLNVNNGSSLTKTQISPFRWDPHFTMKATFAQVFACVHLGPHLPHQLNAKDADMEKALL